MSGNYNSNLREWMYRRIDEVTGNFSEEFRTGVEQFMAFANSQLLAQDNRGRFYYPCSVCKNGKSISGSRIWNHLFSRGFMPDYIMCGISMEKKSI